ncbi:MAG: SRPBCC domain-containing protein [Chloroflexi bacterium]|nr:SRPBCC domain-containing protein [Chloroflexota bacterium]
MTMSETEPTSLTRRVNINASAATVYRYLTDSSLIAEWMGQMAVFEPFEGGDYRVVINETAIAGGKVVELVQDKKVVFSFGWESEDTPVPSGSSRVEITLVEKDGTTQVELTHTGLVSAAVAGHGEGWDHYMGRLAIAAAGGNPGPDPLGNPPAND